LTAWAGLLSRLGSGLDLVIGTPIANRNRAETEGLIGFFVNSLAIRIATEPAATLRSLLATVRDASVGAFAHQDFPFERLVAELGGVRGGNAPPIYQVSFAFQNLPAPVMLPGLTTTVEEVDGGSAKLDLGLVVTPVEGGGLAAQLELNLDLFDPATGARLLAGFERMAAELAAHPERTLAEAELLGAAERQQLLTEWREGDLALEPVLEECADNIVIQARRQ
jgi:non-ribosomal peptide synthetase component F